MSFKFNWGTGIFMFIGLFLLSMVALIYFSSQQRFDLVETEYYPQSLEYQQQIDRIANARAMTGKISIEQQQHEIVFTYPADFKGKTIKGTVLMFRPSDQYADFTDNIRFDTALVQRISTERMKTGKYIAKIAWIMDGKEYYHEENLRITR